MQVFKRLVIAAVMFHTTLALTANTNSAIQNNSAIRKGTLANGFIYYIIPNDMSNGKANFYLIQRTGALQEEDDQLGLAHFLEHLCFRGTTHFPGQTVVNYCQSLGLEFGTDLNATTQLDNTIYSIENVPTRRPSTIDSCLLILSDWAAGIRFDQKTMDEERLVIMEEWRTRRSATARLLERNLPQLHPKSRYGLRTTLGSVDAIRDFSSDALQRYYRTWYHPANQAVVVVGDVSPERVAPMLDSLFARHLTPSGAQTATPFSLPENTTPIVVTDYDNELPNSYVKLFIKHHSPAADDKNTVNTVLDNFAQMAAIALINQRLAQQAQEVNGVFAKATLSYGDYIYTPTQKALQLSVVPRQDNATDIALQGALEEVTRAAQYGFDGKEYESFKQALLQDLNRARGESNRQLFELCKDNFLYGSAMPSNAWIRNLLNEQVPGITAERLRQGISKHLKLDGHNMVIASFCRQAGPTPEALLQAVERARNAKLTPYIYKKLQAGQLVSAPEPGAIVRETHDSRYGTTTLTLSNGATVVLRRTESLHQPVVLRAEGSGGCSQYDKADLPNVKYFNNALAVGGMGQLNATQLSHWLREKQATFGINMDDRYTHMNLSAPVSHFNDLLQLTYSCLTDIRYDAQAFEAYRHRMEGMLASVSANTVFTDSVNDALYLNGEWMLTMRPDELRQVNYNRVLTMWRDATADMSQWTFYVTGFFDEDDMRAAICQWLASVPAREQKLGSRKGAYLQLRQGKVRREFSFKATTPSANTYMLWHSERMAYSPERAILLELAGQMLSTMMLNNVRSGSMAAYTCDVKADVTLSMGHPVWSIYVISPMNPDKVHATLDAFDTTVKSLATAPDAQVFAEAKALLTKKYTEGGRGNNFWDDAVYRHSRYGIDVLADYASLLASQTPETLRRFMAQFLKGSSTTTVIMNCKPH